MRISNSIKQDIINATHKYFGNSEVYLFGSRVDDSKRGGDIDLFIKAKEYINYQSQIDFLTDLHKNTTERKIDLIMQTPSSNEQKIFQIAQNTGIKLC